MTGVQTCALPIFTTALQEKLLKVQLVTAHVTLILTITVKYLRCFVNKLLILKDKVEFLLLHYFMRNPRIVLSTEQICDHAWGNEGSYANGVSGPIAILRKAIEPDPTHPVYIQTVKSMGYCFTGIHVETCDKCRDSVGAL